MDVLPEGVVAAGTGFDPPGRLGRQRCGFDIAACGRPGTVPASRLRGEGGFCNCRLNFPLHPEPSNRESPASLISTTEELKQLSTRVAQAPWIALDTEADSLHAYPEKLCLIQLAIPGEELLIDPLADLHLEPLWEAMDGRELIFHAADYDLRLIYQGHFFRPAAIFDTMWAARLLGELKFGLNDVLTKYLGITLEKGAQKANWGRRPLTERMIVYALNDVRHLHELESVLRDKLVALGRLEWHRQCCAQLISDCAKADPVDYEQVWRIKGHDRLDPLGLAILRELYWWREEDARRTNRPPFFVLSHDKMSELAEAAARRGEDVALPHFLTPRRRRGVMEAIERGLAVPSEKRPNHVRVKTRRLTRRELLRAEALKERRDARAKELNIDPTIIAARAQLFGLAREDMPGEWDALLPWQRELLQDPPEHGGAVSPETESNE